MQTPGTPVDRINQPTATMSYMQELEQELRLMLARITQDADAQDELVAYVKAKALTSFRNGVQAECDRVSAQRSGKAAPRKHYRR